MVHRTTGKTMEKTLPSCNEVTAFGQVAESMWNELHILSEQLNSQDNIARWFRIMYDLDQKIRDVYVRIIDSEHDPETRKECACLAREIDRKNQQYLREWVERGVAKIIRLW